MPLLKFLGFPTGATVTASATQGSDSASVTVEDWGTPSASVSLSILTRRSDLPEARQAPEGISFEAIPLGFEFADFGETYLYEPAFHEVQYEWDFGDNAAPWTAPRLPAEFNDPSKGFGKRVGHVYTKPGTYTVLCTARQVVSLDPLVVAEATATTTVTVADPDVVFDATNTVVCDFTSEVPDFADAPPGVQVSSPALLEAAVTNLWASGTNKVRVRLKVEDPENPHNPYGVNIGNYRFGRRANVDFVRVDSWGGEGKAKITGINAGANTFRMNFIFTGLHMEGSWNPTADDFDPGKPKGGGFGGDTNGYWVIHDVSARGLGIFYYPRNPVEESDGSAPTSLMSFLNNVHVVDCYDYMVFGGMQRRGDFCSLTGCAYIPAADQLQRPLLQYAGADSPNGLTKYHTAAYRGNVDEDAYFDGCDFFSNAGWTGGGGAANGKELAGVQPNLRMGGGREPEDIEGLTGSWYVTRSVLEAAGPNIGNAFGRAETGFWNTNGVAENNIFIINEVVGNFVGNYLGCITLRGNLFIKPEGERGLLTPFAFKPLAGVNAASVVKDPIQVYSNTIVDLRPEADSYGLVDYTGAGGTFDKRVVEGNIILRPNALPGDAGVSNFEVDKTPLFPPRYAGRRMPELVDGVIVPGDLQTEFATPADTIAWYTPLALSDVPPATQPKALPYFGLRRTPLPDGPVQGAFYAPAAASGPGAAAFTVTGGTATQTSDTDHDYWVFDDDATITVTEAGYVQAQLIGGGGAGGLETGGQGGGGGAGALIENFAVYLEPGEYPISIGAGGVAGFINSSAAPEGFSPAGNTEAFGIIAGFGGQGIGNRSRNPSAGACGGGGSRDWRAIGSLGGNGGFGNATAGTVSGGGGGMGGDGQNGTPASGTGTPRKGGDGGPGVISSFLPDDVVVCEGGGGSVWRTTGADVPGVGPNGAGGTGAIRSGSIGTSATTPGSGGGGSAVSNGDRGGPQAVGANGYKGRVAVRIPKSGVFGVSIDEPAYDSFMYPLNDGLTAAPVTIGIDVAAPDGTTVEYRVVDAQDGSEVVGWTTAGVSSGNRVDTTLSIPAHSDACKFQARLASEPTHVAEQSSKWFTAIFTMSYGQSNMGNAEGPSVLAEELSPRARMVGTYGFTTPAELSSGLPRSLNNYINELVELTDLPVMHISGGQGGSPIGGINEGTGPYAKMIASFEYAGATNMHAAMFNHGEGQGMGGFADNWQSYLEDFDDLFSSFAGYFGKSPGELPIEVTPVMPMVTQDGAPQQSDVNWGGYRMFQAYGLTDRSVHDVTFSAPSDDIPRDSLQGYHTGFYRFRVERSARWVASMIGAASDPGRFEVTAATATNGTTTTLTVAHGLGDDFGLASHLPTSGNDRGIVTETSLTRAFEVTADGWATPVSCTAVRTNATTITLTHADIGTASRRVRYNYGLASDQTTGKVEYVRDNSEYGVPLMYFNDFAVSGG